MTLADLWNQLVNHSDPRGKIDGKPTKFLLDLYKQNILSKVKKN